MVDDVGDVFKLRHCISTDIPEPQQGDRRHSFIYGWQRYYGTEWIAEYLWVNIKLKGL